MLISGKVGSIVIVKSCFSTGETLDGERVTEPRETGESSIYKVLSVTELTLRLTE
jgi:hypothetical protein